mgnify:CR=1 FL=1
MMRLALVLASAVAFTPAPRFSQRTVSMMASEKSQAIPFLPKPAGCDGSLPGDVGFDPLGLSSIDPKSLPQIIPPAATMAPAAPLPTMYWMREAELKHGRLCMLALVGFASVDIGFTFPGAEYQGVTSVAAHDINVANGNMGFLLTAIAIIEIISSVGISQAANGGDRAPGDFAVDPLNFCSNEENTMKYKTMEITHCRLAMFAFSGMVTQAVAVNDHFPYM